MSHIPDNDITTDRRPYVMELQTYLRALQRNQIGTTTVPRDGFFGADTAGGVREFQQNNGLPVTGTADRETWEAIVLAYEATQLANAPPLPVPRLTNKTLQVGDRNNDVYLLLIMLNALSATYRNLPPQIVENGYTQQTADAIRALQAAAALPVTGETDKATWDAVVLLYSTLTAGGAFE